MPNANPDKLKLRKALFICKLFPNCKWIKTQGGSRPDEPPSIFEGIAKSCLKQVQSKPRRTKLSSSDARSTITTAKESENDKIRSFNNFVEGIGANVDTTFNIRW